MWGIELAIQHPMDLALGTRFPTGGCMKLRNLSCIAICFAIAGGAVRAGSVDVAFVHPELFTHVRDQNLDAAPNLHTIAEYLQSLGQRLCEPVLTGRCAQCRSGWQIASLAALGMGADIGGQLDWPRMTLNYRLVENGTVSASGQDAIADMAYSSHLDSYPGWRR